MNVKKSLFNAAFILSPVLFATGCGVQSSSSSTKVSNGKDLPESEYPAVVMLYDKVKKGVCTGTFIDAETVITAAHCTMGGKVVNKSTGEVEGSIAIIEMGDKAKKETKVIAESVAVYRNPVWDDEFKKTQVNKYDLAILKFPKGTAKATRGLSPNGAVRGDNITIIGYGLNFVPERNKKPETESIGTKRLGMNTVALIRDGFINFSGQVKTTTGDGTNANAAPGDSGGPMFNEEGELVGITSGGGRLFGRGISLYIDLRSDVSQDFLSIHGIN